MIAAVIEASVRNRVFVLLIAAMAAMVGWWAVKNTPVDAIPDLGPDATGVGWIYQYTLSDFAAAPQIPVIVVTAFGSVDSAVRAIEPEDLLCCTRPPNRPPG